MNRADAIACIQGEDYISAANYIVKSIAYSAQVKIYQLRREPVTTTVAESLKKKHKLLKARDTGLTSWEMSEQVYENTIMELDSPKDSARSLSDQVND